MLWPRVYAGLLIASLSAARGRPPRRGHRGSQFAIHQVFPKEHCKNTLPIRILADRFKGVTRAPGVAPLDLVMRCGTKRRDGVFVFIIAVVAVQSSCVLRSRGQMEVLGNVLGVNTKNINHLFGGPRLPGRYVAYFAWYSIHTFMATFMDFRWL